MVEYANSLPTPCQLLANSLPTPCLGYAKSYQSMMLEVNKRGYLEGSYLKTHCDKKKSVREVLSLLMERVAE